jgi:hypothetical protein
MPRFASHSLLALVVLLAASGCGARAVADSPVKSAATCTPAEGERRSEAECLRQVLGELAALDANEQHATRRTAVTAWAAHER